MSKRNKSCPNLFTEGKRPIKWHFIDVHKNKNLVRHNISFLLSINNEHLKYTCKRCFILKKKKGQESRCLNVYFKWKEKCMYQLKMPHCHSVLLPPNRSFYCNSCAHAKKSLKHTQYIYRYSNVYMYIYNIYINFYLNKKESSNPKPICVYQILDQPGL